MLNQTVHCKPQVGRQLAVIRVWILGPRAGVRSEPLKITAQVTLVRIMLHWCGIIVIVNQHQLYW